MNEFRKTYIVVGLVAKRLHFEKGMGTPEVKGRCLERRRLMYTGFECRYQKRLGYCFRAFGGYDIQPGDQPARMLDRG